MSVESTYDLPLLKAKVLRASLSLVERHPFLGPLTLHTPVYVEPPWIGHFVCDEPWGLLFRPSILAEP